MKSGKEQAIYSFSAKNDNATFLCKTLIAPWAPLLFSGKERNFARRGRSFLLSSHWGEQAKTTIEMSAIYAQKLQVEIVIDFCLYFFLHQSISHRDHSSLIKCRSLLAAFTPFYCSPMQRHSFCTQISVSTPHGILRSNVTKFFAKTLARISITVLKFTQNSAWQPPATFKCYQYHDNLPHWRAKESERPANNCTTAAHCHYWVR